MFLPRPYVPAHVRSLSLRHRRIYKDMCSSILDLYDYDDVLILNPSAKAFVLTAEMSLCLCFPEIRSEASTASEE